MLTSYLLFQGCLTLITSEKNYEAVRFYLFCNTEFMFNNNVLRLI